jgi:membrane-associated protease RseP (regulator of RpoE activity)
MSMSQLRGAVEWALMVGLVFGAGAVAQANNDESQVEDQVIQIGPADADAAKPAAAAGVAVDPNAVQQELPKYWIGMLGGPVTPDLRHHVEIPENEGVLIREVVPASPAAKAGLEQFDIVLRANDTVLHEMRDLVDLVRSEGEKKTQITLEVLRHGSRETVYVTPEERPAQVAQSSGPDDGLDGGFEGLPPGLQQFFGRGAVDGGAPFHFRHFGHGMIGGGGMAGIPNGVSVSIQKQDGQPAHITVQRGEETWEVVGDDPKSLEQLPEDLRPFVAQLLDGGQGGFHVDMPEIGPHGRPGRPVFDGEQLRERLEAMERRLEEMQQRLQAGEAASDEPAEEQN